MNVRAAVITEVLQTHARSLLTLRTTAVKGMDSRAYFLSFLPLRWHRFPCRISEVCSVFSAFLPSLCLFLLCFSLHLLS